MPKVIQPRRHDKQLTVEEFWKIKEYGKQNNQKQQYVPAYREQEVKQRNRYLRPSERAKIFNPLTLLLKRQLKEQKHTIYDINDDQNTHMNQYMSQVQYKMHPYLIEVKKYVQGRKSIIYNIEKIYEILFNRLDVEEAWTLLQITMKDAKNQRFDIWMDYGLKNIAQSIEAKVGLDFNEIFFKNLYNTICVLMQSYYESIVKHLQQYFLVFCDKFMKNNNKYIRKFSIQVFSYILSNLDEQNYKEFINFLVQKQKQSYFDDKVKLADLLLQRLSIVRGCLTTASLANFFDQIQILQNIFTQEEQSVQQQSSSFSEITSDYIFLLLKTVNNKQQINDDSKILFDFNYIVKGIIDYSKKDDDKIRIYTPILLKAFSTFIALYKTDKKKFTGFNPFQISYIQKIWHIFSSYFQQNASFFQQSQLLNEAISILMIKSIKENLFHNNQIIKYCKSSQSIAQTLINIIYQQQNEFNDKLIEIVLLLSKTFIQKFIINDEFSTLIYRLLIIIKRVGLKKLIQFSWIQVQSNQLTKKLQRSYSQSDLIVILRFLTFINVDGHLASQLYEISSRIYQENMKQYQQFMQKLMNQQSIDSQMSGNQFYKSSNFTKQIIQFSHHEIKWLSHIFNFYQAFSLLNQHLLAINPSIKLISQSEIWNQLIISRPSAVKILNNNIRKSSKQINNNLILHLLSSRIRQVRLNALQQITQQLNLQDSYQHQIINHLIQVDTNNIDLDNERQIKRIFINLQKILTNFINNIKDEVLAKIVLKILIKWSLGFAFTGFKLIQASFISFFQIIINMDLKDNEQTQTIVAKLLIPFLSYYNYRHSRQYQYDITPSCQTKHITNAYSIEENVELKELIKEDLQLIDVETVQWIGLERISQAIKLSKKGKDNLGRQLQNMVSAYFQIQFKRQKMSVQAEHEIHQKQFLLPIKQRFLITMLKLCPKTILPPYQCLHFTREAYFQVSKVKAIKKNKWQQMWQKKKSDTSKKKIQIAEISSTTVNLQHLSPEQQQMYIHYLWKDILQSNRHKKRIIIDHIRNYLPTASQILIKLLFKYFYLDTIKQTNSISKEQYIQVITNRLKKFNRKNLLNGMFIMKAILLHMRQQITNQNNLKQIFILILSIIQIAYNYGHEKSIQQKGIHQQQHEEDQQINQEQDEQPQQQSQKDNEANLFKQHRKQLQKLLQTLFSNHDLESQTISELLEYIFSNSKLNLTKTSRLSVPGLLLVLQIISQEKQFCEILVKIRDGQIIKMLTEMIGEDQNGGKPIKACYQIWLKIMDNILVKEDKQLQAQTQISVEYQSAINQGIKLYTQQMLQAIISYISSKGNKLQIQGQIAKAPSYSNKNKDLQDNVKMLRIISKIMILHQSSINNKGWQTYLWNQFNKLSKTKKELSKQQCQKLSLLINILTRYINLNKSLYDGDVIIFLRKIINILPSIKQTQLRSQVLNLMVLHYKELGLNQQIVKMVLNLNQLKKVGLIITLDFPLFFQACNAYTSSVNNFSIIDNQYFLNNIICYVDNEQLSIRRAVSNCNKTFLESIQQKIQKQHAQNSIIDQKQEKNLKDIIFIIIKLYRDYLNLLQKHYIQKNDSIYWNIVDIIGQFYEWISKNQQHITKIYPVSNFSLYPLLNSKNSEDQNYFKLLGSISEANKLKGLKAIRVMLQGLNGDNKKLVIDWNYQTDFDVPNPLSKFILPLLEFLILKTTDKYNNNNTVKSNLSSTFSKSSYDLIPLVSSFLKESLIKKQLKRLISKLKFTQNDHKKNMAVIKIISHVVDGIDGDKANEKLSSFIEEHGFDQFHSKIAQFSKVSIINTNQGEDQSEDQYQTPKNKQKERLPDYYDRLEQLQSQEAINRNFMHFDKKMMSIEDQQEQEDKGLFSYFLKNQILNPLRAMLMMESKSKKEEELAKNRILLSVTLTKVLLRLPLEVFLKEFQKIVGKLCRLLKKRQVQYRQNARHCLCQIAKSVGPQLLYAIILQLKFYLKDNFDKHVFNYTIFKILQSMQLKSGQLDYCLPLMLPMVIDEIFGRTAEEKEMVSKRQVPTLKIEAKKRKGLELIQLICKHVSHNKLNYIIEFLEKYLREHLVTEINLGKYDLILGSISAGLSHNQGIINPIHATLLLQSLSKPIQKLRESIKILKWDDKLTYQNTLKKEWVRRKAGKQQILMLQEEAGRNGSIFKKMNKQIGQLRNQEIIASSLTQFYLILISLFIRKHVFTLSSTTSTIKSSNHMMSLLSFLCECIDHRDNRLVSKSLKILHLSLKWNLNDLINEKQIISDKFKSLKKQTSKKILLLIEQLTISDEELLKECFVFLNDLISEITLNLEILPNFITIIKLHIPNTAEQPHLPQTYELLRTIICKCQQYIYNPLLDDLHKLIRMQLVTCYHKEIRQIFKKILKFYLEPRQVLQRSLQEYNRKKVNNKQKLSYQKVIKQQITFYLSNLQSTGRQTILQLLDEFVNNRDIKQLQTYAQLLILGMITARTNQISNERSSPIDKLIIDILQKIDQSKIIQFVQKCLQWMKFQRKSSIRFCGCSLLRIILSCNSLKINKTIISKYIENENGIFDRIAQIFQQQTIEFEQDQDTKTNHKIQNKQWSNILNNMDIENNKYQCDNSIFEVLLQLNYILEHHSNMSLKINTFNRIVVNSWKLLRSSNVELSCLIIEFLMTTLHILPILADVRQDNQVLLYNDKVKFSFKKTLITLIFNDVPKQKIEQLLKKILAQQYNMQNGHKLLEVSSWLFVGFGIKAHMKTKIYQKVLPNLLYLLNNVALGQTFKQTVIKIQNYQAKIIEMTVKLGSNQLISQQSKSQNQNTSQILKELIGVGQYFKAVGFYQSKRRQKKQQQRIKIAQLAINNPQQFIQKKRQKQRKF